MSPVQSSPPQIPGNHQERFASRPEPREAKPLTAGELELFARLSRRQIPTGALTRLWAVGSMQAQVCMAYLAGWLRSGLADQDGKERLRGEAHLAAGLKLLATMGYLRGAVMKVGQLLANLPEVVPEEIAETLGALHFEAQPMHYAMVREVFLDELGSTPESLFAEFDKKAFAAASLGQVHRARLQSGEEVAVKVQYPHMARTIKADMANLRFLLKPLTSSKDWLYLREGLRDVEEMLGREADYRQEAQFCGAAGQLFSAEADGVVIPRVFAQFSTGRILTMDYLPGHHLKDFLATDPPQAARDHYAELLATVSLRFYYRGHCLFADPHPGNFLFMPDGRLGVVDFGCTRRFTEREWQLQSDLEEAFFAGDTPTIRRLIAESCYLAPGEDELIDTLTGALAWQLEPMATEGLFDWGDGEFFRRGVAIYGELIRKRLTRGMPHYIWTNRFLFGFRAISYRLRGRNGFAEKHRLEKGVGGSGERHE
jgi:predicted unusual protein kinase regulating ubiquinone biosynthesis (AarF/ABC1/UbiB family)